MRNSKGITANYSSVSEAVKAFHMLDLKHAIILTNVIPLCSYCNYCIYNMDEVQ